MSAITPGLLAHAEQGIAAAEEDISIAVAGLRQRMAEGQGRTLNVAWMVLQLGVENSDTDHCRREHGVALVRLAEAEAEIERLREANAVLVQNAWMFTGDVIAAATEEANRPRGAQS